MALTNTTKAKEFVAGAPLIKLKGDLRPKQDMKMAGPDRYFKILEFMLNELEGQLGRELTSEEYDEVGRKAMEEYQNMSGGPILPSPEDPVNPFRPKPIGPVLPDRQMASGPDLTDSRNELALELFGKELKLLTEEEMDILNDEAQRLMQKFMADGGRAQYGLGSIVKSVKKAVKGVGKGIKSLAKSPLGLVALNFAPMLIPGGASTFFGGRNAMFNIGNILGLTGDKTGTGAAMDALKVGGAGAVITGLLAEREQQDGESNADYANRRAQVNDQLKVQFSRLYPKGEGETPEDYDTRITAMVEAADDQTITPGQFAVGGRVSRAFGSDKLVEQASGIEGLPINMNSKGVKELDMRETGGFIPPVGVKEKADDIPAMLSNNEFVFTADAVRAAGGGSVNKGAQRMYDLMKTLESKVG